MYNKIIKWSIYLLVFFLPIFFLPFSFEAFEFNKQYLLFFLVSLAFLAWLTKMVLVDKEIKFKRSPLDLFVLAFLFVAVLSAIFSVDKGSSLFGFYARFSDGLIGLLSLGALYFLITNNVGIKIKNQKSKTELPKEANVEKRTKFSLIEEDSNQALSVGRLMKIFLWSVFFVVLFSYFSIFGVWAGIDKSLGEKISFPSIMLQTVFNPTAGSMEGLAVFLSVVLIFLIGRTLTFEKKTKRGATAVNYLLLISVLLLLVIIDFNPAWLMLLLSLVLFLAVVLWKRIFKENVNKLLLPILFVVLSIVFLFINTSNIQGAVLKYYLPQEQVLGQGASWLVGLKSATENVKSGFFGSGIGTFHYGFSKFKPANFNQTLFWQIRFDRSGSHIAEILGTMGFFGLLSYLALIGMFLLISYFFVTSCKSKRIDPLLSPSLPLGRLKGRAAGIVENQESLAKDQKLITLPLLMVFLALLIGQFVFYQNTVLAFSFWLVLGLSVVNCHPPAGGPVKEKTISFKDFPELSLVFLVLLIVLALAFVAMYFFAVKFYLADAHYKGYFESGEGQKLEKAVNLNPFQSQYKLVIARDYLNKLITEGQKPAEQIDENAFSNNIYLAITYAKDGIINRNVIKGAVELSPNRVAVWETLGMIYRDIWGIAAGALDWGKNSFEKAISLEPTNPVLHTELGKLYLISGDSDKAKEKFNKAKELKSDYIDVSVQLSLLYESEGNLEEAIRQMEGLVISYPYNIEVIFQLGRLYLNNNLTDEAIPQFEKAIELFPNHSNSLYSLGLAYQRKGQKEKALAKFEKVLELNPGNADTIAKIEELKKVEIKTEKTEK